MQGLRAPGCPSASPACLEQGFLVPGSMRHEYYVRNVRSIVPLSGLRACMVGGGS